MTAVLRRFLPIVQWLPAYRRSDISGDVSAGLTVGAMLVPQGMAYALLAGLPPEIGLYASTLPLIAYAIFGTSRQLAVGPVAIVSLLTASSLAPYAEQGTSEYIAAAALLALIVGAVHLVLGFARLGFVVNLLSHSVLVGFTAAAALVIGFSQAKHLLGIPLENHERFYETLIEIGENISGTHWLTLAVGGTGIALLLLLRRWKKAFPGALVVVVLSIVASEVFDLSSRGVRTVGDIPSSLPGLGLPTFDGGLASSLVTTALLITLVGFMESIAIAKVYGRRNRYEVDANQELIGLGAANVTAGVFGGYPITGGFSRTAVNADAGARTPLASLITAGIVLLTIVALTPLFTGLPQATLAAIVVVAVSSLFDVKEARHLAKVKRSDLLGLAVAFFGTLLLGIELGIAVAVAVSVAVVVARIMFPHTAELGRLPDTTVYRNVQRFANAERTPGVPVLRIDVALNFANAAFLRKRLAQLEADTVEREGQPIRAIVIDAGGVNDLDASAEATLTELLDDYDDRGIELHLANVKGPVRDVLMRAGLWERMSGHFHVDVDDAVRVASGTGSAQRTAGIDERA